MYEFLGGRQNHYVEPIIFKNEFTIDNLIVVYYNRFSPRFRFAGERHNFYEFYYVAENEMLVTIDNEKYLLKENIKSPKLIRNQFKSIEGTYDSFLRQYLDDVNYEVIITSKTKEERIK